MMSTFDQHGEQYLTAIALAFAYNYIRWLPETITLPARRRRVDGIRRVLSLIQVNNENHADKQHNPSGEKGELAMSATNAVVAIYDSHTQAEEAVKELQKSGFDMKKLSIVGKDYHTEEQVVGYYNTGDRMKYWGKLGRLLGRALGDVVRSRFLRHSRPRPDPGSWPSRRLDSRRSRGRRGDRRIERARRGAVQHWHP